MRRAPFALPPGDAREPLPPGKKTKKIAFPS